MFLLTACSFGQTQHRQPASQLASQDRQPATQLPSDPASQPTMPQKRDFASNSMLPQPNDTSSQSLRFPPTTYSRSHPVGLRARTASLPSSHPAIQRANQQYLNSATFPPLTCLSSNHPAIHRANQQCPKSAEFPATTYCDSQLSTARHPASQILPKFTPTARERAHNASSSQSAAQLYSRMGGFPQKHAAVAKVRTATQSSRQARQPAR